MQKITPCLWFEKDCEGAINNYVSIFNSSPGKRAESRILNIQRYPEYFEGAPWPKEMSDNAAVLTAIFELEGERFMALDGGPGVFGKSGVVSFTIECNSQEEVDHFWNNLTEGGMEQPCGWLTDKYGFAWQVNPKVLGELLSDPNKEKADRVMKAMLQMKKIIIADLEKAALG